MASLLIQKDTLITFHLEDKEGKYAPFAVKDKAVNFLGWYWHKSPTTSSGLDNLVKTKVISEEFRKIAEQNPASMVFMAKRYAAEVAKDRYKLESVAIIAKIVGLNLDYLRYVVEDDQNSGPLCRVRDDTVIALEEWVTEKLDLLEKKNGGWSDADFVKIALRLERGDKNSLAAAYVKAGHHRVLPDGWVIYRFYTYYKNQKEGDQQNIKDEKKKREVQKEQRNIALEEQYQE